MFSSPLSRLATHLAGDTPELRMGSEFSPLYRFARGYIGSIQRPPADKKSRNTSTAFLRHVAIKISWVHTRDPSGPRRQCIFARVLAYTSNFNDSGYSSEHLVSLRDNVKGYVMKPSGNKHSGCNLQFWGFARLEE